MLVLVFCNDSPLQMFYFTRSVPHERTYRLSSTYLHAFSGETPLQPGTNYTSFIHLTAYFTKATKRLKITSFTLSSAKLNRPHNVVKLHNYIKNR